MGILLAGLFAFSSLLRVGELVAEDPRAEAFVWDAVAACPDCFDEITFHTQLNHSVRPLDYHRAVAAKIAPLIGRAEARGLVPGVNVLTTLGFFREEPDAAMTNLPPSVAANGHVRVGRLCPSAPETLAYVRELYVTYARIRPKFIYIDDDVSMCACFCARCRAEFARRFPAAKCGDVPSGPDWIEFCNDRTDAVYGAAEAGAHGVDPSVELGVMFCSSGDNGLDAARWARTLRAHGKGGTVRWRPGGGCWTDHSFDELVDKAYCMAAQVRDLPPDVTAVQAEIENFPYQSLRKSPSFTMFEALFDEAICCTGVAWDFAGFSSRDSEEFKPFFEAVRRTMPALREVSEAFGRTPCSGVSFPWDGHSGTVPRANGLVQVGIPVATDPTLASVALLDAAAVGRLTDAALTNVLSRAAFLDAGALDALNARGFGDLTGFRTDGQAVLDAITRDVVHPLNLEGEHVRDLRVAFGHHKVLSKLAKTADAAETTEVLTDLSGRPCGGLAGGVFENRLGGRIAVETMLPFSFADGRARTVHLKKLLRWLSRDALPAYLASFHKAAVFARGEKVFVANLSTEPMKGGELAIRAGGARRISVYDAGVKTLQTELKPIRAEDAYSVYRLPEIPHLGMALVGMGRKIQSPVVKESSTAFAREALQEYVDSGELPGAISVFYKDGVQETCCIGYADVASKRPIALDNVFMQCSQTKGFCGVCIAKLVEEGKITLDDPVAKYLPEFKELWVRAGGTNGVRKLERAKTVLTVRMCMNHTGGFPFELPNCLSMGGWSHRMPLRSIAATAASQPILFEPGTKHSYSNVGIDIGAAVVEKVTGRRWEDYLQANVLMPLGMDDTGFKPTDCQLANKIELYDVQAGAKAKWRSESEWMRRPYNGDRVFSSAGAGLWTTAADQLKFYKMLMNLGVGENGARILKAETVKSILAKSTHPQGLGGYSLGLVAPFRDDADKWFGHGGAWGTNCMVNWHRKELKLWVVQHPGGPYPWDKARAKAADRFFKTVIDNSAVDAYTGRLK